MKKVAAFLVSMLVLAALYASGGCSGADDVVGPGDPHQVVTPRPGGGTPRVTPNPCRQNPADCD